MSAPEKIYLQVPDEAEDFEDAEKGEMTWCRDKINEKDVEYVRADIVRQNNEARGPA